MTKRPAKPKPAKKAELQAYAKVIRILEPFPDEVKQKIIKATAILLEKP